MFDKYLIENVQQGNILGKIEDIIYPNGIYSEAEFRKILKLNSNGVINILSGRGKYEHGFKIKYNWKERKLSLYMIKMNISYARFKKNTFFIFLKEYAFSFFNMVMLSLLLLPGIFMLYINKGKNIEYIMAFLLDTGIVFSNVLHESGHYFASRLFHVPLIIEISGFSAGVITKTKDRAQIVIIALAGPAVNIAIIITCILLKIICSCNLTINILMCIMVNSIFIINLLPFANDGANILEGIRSRKGDKNEVV